MYCKKLLRRSVRTLAPLACPPIDCTPFPATARRVGCWTALLGSVLFNAPLDAASMPAAPAGSSVASPAPANLTHLAHLAPKKSSIPAEVLAKLDAQIVFALKKSRGEPPYDGK